MSQSTSPSPPPALPSLVGASMILLAYVLLAVAAMVVLRTRPAMPAGSELSLPRIVFTVANAASLSGFQQTIPIESYKGPGQATILALVVMASLASLIVGAAAVVRLLRLPFSLGRIIAWALGVELLAVVVGSAALIGDGRNLFQAAFQSASAVGNCGIVLGAVSPMSSLRFTMLILPLAVIGGLGLPVLMEIGAWLRGSRPLSKHARVVLAMTAAVYLGGGCLLVALQWPDQVPEGSSQVQEVRRTILSSSTTALNSRSLGWPVEAPASWPRAAVWPVLVLMVIGASPAGTGGGMKTTTLFELGRGTWRALRGAAASRMFGIAIVWTVSFLLLILLTTMRLAATEPQLPSDQILFIATSAVGNAGLAFAPISITGEGLYTLSIAMMLGRLVPLGVLWWAALTITDADVAVG